MNFTKINELATQLKGLRPLNETELKRLRDEFIVENTYNSNAIEGSTLTLRETALILQEGVTIAGKNVREHLDAVGHKEAFEYVIELADKNAPLNERTIKELHSIVLMNDRENAGKYRSIPVRILGAKHTPPQPCLVPVQMEGLVADYEQMKTSKHIIEAAAEFHLRFESVHPFIDGNGRCGRLILNLELIKAGLLPVNIKFTDRQRYYSCFDEYAMNNTIEPLAALIAEYEEAELVKRIAIIKGEY